jgi:GT2 family glycosyltransferase
MNNFEKNITFVIVSFKSGHIIEKCIRSINSSIKIIVVENSDNIYFKDYLENKFSNVEVIIAKENLGYGRGNNFPIYYLISSNKIKIKNTIKHIKLWNTHPKNKNPNPIQEYLCFFTYLITFSFILL